MPKKSMPQIDRRKRTSQRRIADYPEVACLLDRLNGGQPSDLISLFLPSVDRAHNPVINRELWKNRALEKFAKLFGGATVFPGLIGIWRDPGGRTHRDNVELIESLVERERINADLIYEFIDFCREMGEHLDQVTVLATFNGKAIWVNIKHADEN